MRLLATLFAFTSFSAIAACPNLSGTYATCRSTTGAMSGLTDMVVTQKNVNGVTLYTMTSTDNESQERTTDEIVADGITHSDTTIDPELGEVVGSFTYACSGPKLTGNVSVIASGSPLMEVNMEIQKKGSLLEMDYSGTAFGVGFSDTLICE